jgi:hypothetical protein
MSKLLTREQILEVQDLKSERVFVEEWGGDVLLRGMTAKERDAYESKMFRIVNDEVEVDKDNMRAKLLAETIVDEEGKRIFEPADIEILGSKNSAVISRLFKVAQRLCGMDKDAVEKK